MEHEKLLSYEEFKDDWLKRHPASIPIERVEDSPYPKWLRSATLLMFLAAALLSAVHTIPVVYAGIPANSIISPETRMVAANASIVAFELGILLSAFLMIAKSSMGLAWVLLGTMFAGTIVANIQSISQTSGAGLGASIVTLIFGGGIPVIALAAGKLFVNIYSTERALKKQAGENNRQAWKDLDATINGAYAKYEKLWKINHSVESPVRHVSAQTNTDKQPKHIALDYLKDHQGESFTVRGLAEAAGVTNDAAHKALKLFATNGHSQNGHEESNDAS